MGNNGHQQQVQNFTNKDLKEFYWNKDKFQSQSLIVFKKRTLCLCANISWLFSEALVAYSASCEYLEKRKRSLYNRSVWHSQLIQQYSCAGYFQTFLTLQRSETCLLIYSFTVGFSLWQRCVTVVMGSGKKKYIHLYFVFPPFQPSVDPQAWCSVCIRRMI